MAEAVYSYDAAGRLAAVADGANAFAYGYASGLPHMLATITANNGTTNVLTTTKTHDPLDRLTEVTATGIVAGVVSSHAYAYNARNQRTKATLADASYWDYAYDDLGQVTGGIKKTAAGTPIPGMAFGYSFDAIGNRLSSTENAATTTYTANLLNQYTARSVPGLAHVRGAASTDAIVTARATVAGTPVAPPSQSQRLGETFFVPLPVDNAAAPFLGAAEVTAVLPAAAPGGEDIVATESRDVRIPQATQTLTYDLDGNLTSDGIWTYAWNAENRLIAMESASALPAPRSRLTFAYDSQGRRFRKTVYAWQTDHWSLTTDHLFIYDNWNLIAELDATTGQPLHTHLWGLDLSGSMQGAGGVGGLLSSTRHQAPSTTHTRFACYDGNGNVTAYVDATTGAKSATFDYDPFGNTVVAEGAALADLKFRFSTKYLDAETGLYYYGLRYYNSKIGRWINRDPRWELGGTNLFGFLANQTTTNQDYLGQMPLWQQLLMYYLIPGWLGKPKLYLFDSAGVMQDGLQYETNEFYRGIATEFCKNGGNIGNVWFSRNAPAFLHNTVGGAHEEYWSFGSGYLFDVSDAGLLSYAIYRSSTVRATGCIHVCCKNDKAYVRRENVLWQWEDELDWNGLWQKYQEAKADGDSSWEAAVGLLFPGNLLEIGLDWHLDKQADFEFKFRITWFDMQAPSVQTAYPFS